MKDFFQKVIQTMESIIEDAKSNSYSNYRTHYRRGYTAAQVEIIAEMEEHLCLYGYNCDEQPCATVITLIELVKERKPQV